MEYSPEALGVNASVSRGLLQKTKTLNMSYEECCISDIIIAV